MWTYVNHVSARTFSIWVDRSMLLRLGTRKGDGKEETSVARASLLLVGWFVYSGYFTTFWPYMTCIRSITIKQVLWALHWLCSLLGGSPPLKVWQGVIWFGNFYRVLRADPGNRFHDVLYVLCFWQHDFEPRTPNGQLAFECFCFCFK